MLLKVPFLLVSRSFISFSVSSVSILLKLKPEESGMFSLMAIILGCFLNFSIAISIGSSKCDASQRILSSHLTFRDFTALSKKVLKVSANSLS